jgi:hypothetical protein
VVEENGQAIGAGKYFATPQPPEKEPKRFLTPFLHPKGFELFQTFMQRPSLD